MHHGIESSVPSSLVIASIKTPLSLREITLEQGETQPNVCQRRSTANAGECSHSSLIRGFSFSAR